MNIMIQRALNLLIVQEISYWCKAFPSCLYHCSQLWAYIVYTARNGRQEKAAACFKVLFHHLHEEVSQAN